MMSQELIALVGSLGTVAASLVAVAVWRIESARQKESRPHIEINASWLHAKAPDTLPLLEIEVRNPHSTDVNIQDVYLERDLPNGEKVREEPRSLLTFLINGKRTDSEKLVRETVTIMPFNSMVLKFIQADLPGLDFARGDVTVCIKCAHRAELYKKQIPHF